MTPNLSLSNEADQLLANSEHLCQLNACNGTVFPYGANIKNLRRGELCASSKLSVSVALPSLIKFVSHILCIRSKSQVVRVATGSPVNTGMKHPHFSRDYTPVLYYPSNPVRTNLNESIGKVGRTAFELPVTIRIKSPLPRPTFVWSSYINLRPKSLLAFLREKLRQELIAYRIWSHKSVSLICATLSAVVAARGHFDFRAYQAGRKHNSCWMLKEWDEV